MSAHPRKEPRTPAARRRDPCREAPAGQLQSASEAGLPPPAQDNAAVDVPDKASELRMGDTATFPGLPRSRLPAPDALLGHTSPAREELLENAKEKATAHS